MTLFFSAPNPNNPFTYGVTPTFFTIGVLARGHVDAGYPGATLSEEYKDKYGNAFVSRGSPEYEVGATGVFWRPASRRE